MGVPSTQTIKRLCINSGNQCAFRNCRRAMVNDRVVVGEIAHICAQRPQGPRYDVHQTEDQRNGYDNLLMLCPEHHRIIDDQNHLHEFTVAHLQEMKASHEQHVSKAPEPMTDVIAQLLTKLSESSSVTIVESHHQRGGITAGTVNVHALPPPPELHHTLEFSNRLAADRRYHTRFMLTFETSYPVSTLRVGVRAASVQDMSLTPQRAGAFSMGFGRVTGYAFRDWQNAVASRIVLDVFTEQPEDKITIEWNAE